MLTLQTTFQWFILILIACFTFVWPSELLGQTSGNSELPPAAENGKTSTEFQLPVGSAIAAPASDTSQVPVVSPHSGDWISLSDEADVLTPLNDEDEVLQPLIVSPAPDISQNASSSMGTWTAFPTRRTYYRRSESINSWLPATGDNLGWISIESAPYHKYFEDRISGAKTTDGINSAINIHWLNGPTNIDLPARVYDFVLGYQKQETIGQRFTYDVAASIGAYSDFEDSAKDGIRYASHAVGILHGKRADFVFGVDYLDRDDIPLLPVIGFSFRPAIAPRWQIDAIFPRPEVSWAFSSTDTLYVRALMGGGSWDIEFPDEANDVMTYRDYQILFGVGRTKDNKTSRYELGFVFQRQMEFRNRPDRPEFDNAFVIRFIQVR